MLSFFELACAPDRGDSEGNGDRLQPVEEATLGATANRCCNPDGVAELQLMAGDGAPKNPYKQSILPKCRYLITLHVGLLTLFVKLPLHHK